MGAGQHDETREQNDGALQCRETQAEQRTHQRRHGRRRKKAKKAIAARWPRYGTALLLARFCLDVVAGALKRQCHEGFRHRERKNAN